MSRQVWYKLGVGVLFFILVGLPLFANAQEPVTVMAHWGGDEEAGFREVLDAFTEKTGIPYSYEGNRDFLAATSSWSPRAK